jgi:hypothetical protein
MEVDDVQKRRWKKKQFLGIACQKARGQKEEKKKTPFI